MVIFIEKAQCSYITVCVCVCGWAIENEIAPQDREHCRGTLFGFCQESLVIFQKYHPDVAAIFDARVNGGSITVLDRLWREENVQHDKLNRLYSQKTQQLIQFNRSSSCQWKKFRSISHNVSLFQRLRRKERFFKMIKESGLVLEAFKLKSHFLIHLQQRDNQLNIYGNSVAFLSFGMPLKP